jgi:hypothetical protein
VRYSHLLGKVDRQGTAYFEFAIGGDEESRESVYVGLDDFDLIEPVFRSCLRSFDYVGPNVVSLGEWEKVTSALEQITMDPASKPGAEVAAELAEWVRTQLRDGRTIFLNGV